LNLFYTTQFKKDYKRLKRQNKDFRKLKDIIDKLFRGSSLAPKHHDHALSGEWKGHRECHIEPDWILIYRLTGEELILERTGSHSDLFE
jgi:mRNA interferase YafQ